MCVIAANVVFGGPRMGPIFGGMLFLGQKVAQQISKKLRQEYRVLSLRCKYKARFRTSNLILKKSGIH